jgi:tryptophan synthase alpha chain
MNAIDAVFHRLRSHGKKAFIPFITAGDPDLTATAELLRQLAGHGASLIEVGFPYSDPIADGPVIQASYTRALSKGLRIDDILQSLRNVAAIAPFADKSVPLVAMISYALIQRRGFKKFIRQAQEAGLSGAIVPDLPIDEADDFARLTAEHDFKLILLVTPTTPRERAVQIARKSTGFLYYVSITGITGERAKLPDELVGQLAWLRRQTDLPICVGFGISTPEHVHTLRDVADGIIVGSALVRKLEQAGARPLNHVIEEVTDLARTLVESLNR